MTTPMHCSICRYVFNGDAEEHLEKEHPWLMRMLKPKDRCYVLANGECISPLDCPHGDGIPLDDFISQITPVFEIAKFCMDKQCELAIGVEAVQTGVEWSVSNYSNDCIPLPGWTWEDEHVTAIRSTLIEAWFVFKSEQEKLRGERVAR